MSADNPGVRSLSLADGLPAELTRIEHIPLAVYRQEVIEELGQWAENHSLAQLDTAIREAITNAKEGEGYLAAWGEIKFLRFP